MKKAVLSNRIFLNNNPELEEELFRKLKYKIPQYGIRTDFITYCDVTRISKDIISIPIGRQDLIPKDYEVIDKRTVVPCTFPEASFTLYPEQQYVYNEATDNCFINAPPSFGKTYTSLAVITKLKQKTLVLVHSINLMEQWANEVEKVLGFKPGTIGNSQYNTESNIVIGTVQTVKNNINKLSSAFGTVVVDECHKIASPTFKNTIDKLKSRYKIGLSATLKRKDNKHVYMPDYIGLKTIVPETTNILNPDVHVIKTNIPLVSRSDTGWAKAINTLVAIPEYKDLVVNLARIYSTMGHKVLVVSDRVEFLKQCSELTENSVCITGEIKSTETRQELQDSIYDYTNVLYGSISIYKEGVNIPALSCLILATPVNNDGLLEQLVGRVARNDENKKHPVVVDIALSGAMARRQLNQRIAYYNSKRMDVKHT